VTFTPAALKLVHQLSGGVPRVVNLLSHRSLLGGYGADKETIDVDIVSAAAEDLDLQEAQAPRAKRPWLRIRVGKGTRSQP
jgi:general secretion pathway protein A